MCDQKKPLAVVVLGGGARVWRAMAPHWPDDMETCVWARRPGPGVNVVSDIDDAAETLPACDVVLAIWGVTSGSPQELAENTSLALSAQQIARDIGAGLVLHVMTGAVYAPSNDPLHETSPTQPRHDYGRAKLAVEQAVRNASPKPVFLRLGNVAGADALAAAVRSKRSIILDKFEDHTVPRRSYVAPDDLAGVIAHLARSDAVSLPEVINVAGPQPVAMDALLDAAGIPYSLRPAPKAALPVQHLDTERLSSLGCLCPASARPDHLARFLPLRGADE